MRVITREDYEAEKQQILARIQEGVVFIYPTDTIYGIGCDATDPHAVTVLRRIKQRAEKPFSVIAPSKSWVLENCYVPDKSWLDKLPGPYTLILKLKKKQVVCEEVNLGSNTLGVRLLQHWTQEIPTLLGTPIVTTSANILNKDFMTNLHDLDEQVGNEVDFIIYEGEKKQRPSKIVDMTKEKVIIIER